MGDDDEAPKYQLEDILNRSIKITNNKKQLKNPQKVNTKLTIIKDNLKTLNRYIEMTNNNPQ